MTIKQARKILGKASRDISDEQIKDDIRTATLLKDLFFNSLIESKKRIQSAQNK
ncbi:hypothetical protein ACFL1M_04635 [Patescibacteria group bacterium]